MGIIVGLVSLCLHRHECIGKVLYLFGKLADLISILAGILAETMLKRPIDLMPSRFAPNRAGAADQ
jgi:hypothetical protein